MVSRILFFAVLVLSFNSLAGQDFDCSNKEDGSYENPKECSSFYKCSKNSAYLYTCNHPLQFNPALKICDWPEDFHCDKGIEKQQVGVEWGRRITETDDIEFDCSERQSGLYPNTDNCQTFYKCSNGYTYLYDCPGNLFFNPELLVCDWPENVPSCQDNVTTGVTDTTNDSPSSGPEEPETENPSTELQETESPSTELPETENPSTELPETENPSTELPETENPSTELPETENPSTELPETENPSTELPEAPETENPSTELPEEPETENPSTELPEEPETENPSTELPEEPKTENPSTELPEEPETENPSTGIPETENPSTEDSTTENVETSNTASSGTEESNAPTTEFSEFSCESRPSGLYPNPSDCSTFYKCSNGYKYLYDCPNNLLFNPDLLVCDWPYNVPSCQGVEPGTNEPESPSTKVPDEPETENPSTQLPEDPETENPSTELSEVSESENPHTENPEDSTTEDAENPDTVKPITEESNKSTTEFPEEFSCENRPSGLYVNPGDCSSFYKCSNGYKYLYDCPNNLLFNPDLLVCDWPYNVPTCQGSDSTTEGETENPSTEVPEGPSTETDALTTQAGSESLTSGEPSFCEELPSGLYPNTKDCHTFYKCSNGNSYLYNCPSILLFNPDLLVCDWPNNVPSCLNPETGSPESSTQTERSSTVSTTEASTEFSCLNKPNGLYANPSNCETFYKCSNGYQYLYECPSNLRFNSNLLGCDWPQNVVCSSETV